MEYKKHRLNIYPEMQEDEFSRLRTNIFANGFDEKYPIYLFEGEIIDGWNRYKACKALNINPVFKNFEGNSYDAMQLIIRSNDRRDLTSSQRAAIAVEAEELVAMLKEEAAKRYAENVGRPPKESGQKIAPINDPEQNKVRTQLAQTFGTNRQYVSDAAKIKENNPVAFNQILSGEKTISDVKKEIKIENRLLQIEETKEKIKIIRENDKNINNKSIEVKKGEWFSLGRHKIYCGNNTDKNFIDNLPKCSFAFADPPYNANVDEWDNNFTWNQDYLQDYAKVVAVTPGGWNANNLYIDSKMNYQWELACWIKNGMTHGKCGYSNWIKISVFSHDINKPKIIQDFKEITIKTSETEETHHKGRKPYPLMEWLIDMFTNVEDVVIDPFLGSGTTLLQCDKMARICYGAEMNIDYCNDIINRFYNLKLLSNEQF